MTEAAASPEAPATLSPRDEARVRLALYANVLANEAAKMMRVNPDADPGDLLRAALALRENVEGVIKSAVIAERESGTTWEQLGATADMSRQAAHERWSQTVTAWASNGRAMQRKPSGTKTTMELARRLDEDYARIMVGPANAVSAGLDAVRFPGSDLYEHDRRRRGTALHARREELTEQAEANRTEYKTLKARYDTDQTDQAACADLAANTAAVAVLYDQLADVHEQLVTAEPALAEEHRGQAEQYRGWAQNNRKYVKLLTGTPGEA